MTKLEIQIAHARENLHTLWETKGYTDAEVLDASMTYR